MFDEFFKDFFFRQKYFFKHPEELENQMKKYVGEHIELSLLNFTKEFFDVAARIRYI